MSRIPEFRRARVFREADPSSIAAAGQVADAVANLGAQAFEIGLRFKNAEDNTFATNQTTKTTNKLDEMFTSLTKQFTDSPRGKEKEFKEAFEGVVDQMAQEAPSSLAEKKFRQFAGNRVERFNGLYTRWSNKTFLQNEENALKDSQAELEISALRGGSSEAIFNALGDNAVLAGIKQEEFGEINMQNYLKVSNSSIAQKGFRGFVEQNLSGAKEALESKAFDDVLGAQGIINVKRMIGTSENAAKINIDSLEKWRITDPYKYLNKVNEARPSPIDFANPAESMRERALYMDEKNAKHGIDLPLLSNNEMLQMTTAVDKLQPGAASDVLSDFESALTPRQLNQFFRQLNSKDSALVMAVSMANEAPDTTEKILAGRKRIKSPKGVVLPITNKFKTEVGKHLGTAVQRADIRESAVFAVRAWYAEESALSGKEGVDIDPEIMEQALASVVGPAVEINGTATLSFRKDRENGADGAFASEDEIDLRWEQAKIKGFDRQKRELDDERLKDNAILIPAGDGLYRVILEFGGVREDVLDASGRSLIVDLKKVKVDLPGPGLVITSPIDFEELP